MSHADVPSPNSEEILEQLKSLLVDPRDALLEREMRYLRKINDVKEKYGEKDDDDS